MKWLPVLLIFSGVPLQCKSYCEQRYTSLEQSRRSLGLFQHHDGITGTAKDHVVVDYGNRLLTAYANSQVGAHETRKIITRELAPFQRLVWFPFVYLYLVLY